MLGVSHPQFRGLLACCGITLEPVELHYTDERPRKTNYRRTRGLTGPEVKKLIKYCRASQGAKALATRRRAPR